MLLHYPEGQDSWLRDDCQSSYSAPAGAITEDHTITTLDESGLTCSTDSTGWLHEVTGNATTNNAESSTGHMSKGKEKALEIPHGDEHITHALCSACREPCPRFDILQLGCKRPEDAAYHAYCRSCLIDLFKTSLTDTTLFPPRCCSKSTPISACLQLCPPALVTQYKEKQLELASPNPVYCSNRYCAEFIKAECVTADIAICGTCLQETCTICKNPRHKGLCLEDPTVQILMDLAGEQRWQRCPRCRTMVELLVGCYHMR